MAVDSKVTVAQVNETLQDHLQRHEDHYDPELKRMHDAIYGEDGRDGIQHSLTVVETKLTTLETQILSMNATIKNVGIGLFLSIVAAILTFLLTAKGG